MTMAPDPITAALDQLAAHREHITTLDAREASHFAEVNAQLTQLASMISALGRALVDSTAAMARLDALDRQVSDLLAATGHGAGDADGYQPGPAPAWWKLTPDERQSPLTELRAWVEQVYRPGYGHLAAALRPCWPEHDLCLYGLDVLYQLWTALYLQPHRTTALLSAQAEYQARILPALATQLATETTRCGHRPACGNPRRAR
jgi:hypothetical protein